ncbi:MAG: hypothetical protein ABL973_13610 [Micropepsaceae bacterium]
MSTVAVIQRIHISADAAWTITRTIDHCPSPQAKRSGEGGSVRGAETAAPAEARRAKVG